MLVVPDKNVDQLIRNEVMYRSGSSWCMPRITANRALPSWGPLDKSHWCGKSEPKVPRVLGPHSYQAEAAWRQTAPQPPKWSLGARTRVATDDRPTPIYNPDPNTNRQVPPSWSMGAKDSSAGGLLAAQARIEKEFKNDRRLRLKELAVQGNSPTMEFGMRTMSSPLLQAGAEHLATPHLLEHRGSLPTGSLACLPTSRLLQSSGRNQMCSVRSQRSGCAGNVGPSVLSSASFRKSVSNAVRLELLKQMLLPAAEEQGGVAGRAAHVREESQPVAEPFRKALQPVARQQRLEGILQRASGSS